METIFGIDFGTSNSALSVYRDGRVEIVDIDEHNPDGKTLRSVLYFDKDRNVYVGQEAIDHYVEDGASGRLLQSIKNFLSSDSFKSANIFGKPYTIEELAAIILRHIKKRGEKFVGHEVTKVVLGRPVTFSDEHQNDKLAEERLLAAAKLAGFTDIRFQFEPVAAALSFEDESLADKEKIMLVGDFGGGTSDFTVIRLSKDDNGRLKMKKDGVLSLSGLAVGGNVLDSAIMWHRITKYFGRGVTYKTMSGNKLDFPVHILRTLCKWHLIPHLNNYNMLESIRQIKVQSDNSGYIENLERLISYNFGFFLFQAIEKGKTELSARKMANVIYEDFGLKIDEEISRREFEEMIAEELQRIEKSVDEALLDAKLETNDIDSVILTGGTSYIPAVREIFVKRFGAAKVSQIDAFTSVVYGLGVSAPLLFVE